MALLKRIALSLELFESRVDSIAIILMDIKSEVADLILFKKRVESILLLASVHHPTYSSLPSNFQDLPQLGNLIAALMKGDLAQHEMRSMNAPRQASPRSNEISPKKYSDIHTVIEARQRSKITVYYFCNHQTTSLH